MDQTHLERPLAKAQKALESAPRFQLREPERKEKESDHSFRLRTYEMLLEDLAKFKDDAEKRVAALQHAIDAAAYNANESGLSWGKVGRALGMTSQGAHKRYAAGAQDRNLENFRKEFAQELAAQEKPNV